MDKTITVWGRGIACALTLALAGCNFQGSDSSGSQLPPVSQNPASNPTNPGSSGNVAPQIAGAPNGEVLVGRDYSFRPNATDPDGDTLSFSIEGQPSWASFNSSTGRLYGTPTAADTGSYEEIVISVSDGSVARQLPQFGIQVVEQTDGSVTLAWEPPTENTDGTALVNLSGYRIHYGNASGNYDQIINVANAGVTRYVVDNLSPGTYFFAISAVSSAGVESETSPEASKTI